MWFVFGSVRELKQLHKFIVCSKTAIANDKRSKKRSNFALVQKKKLNKVLLWTDHICLLSGNFNVEFLIWKRVLKVLAQELWCVLQLVPPINPTIYPFTFYPFRWCVFKVVQCWHIQNGKTLKFELNGHRMNFKISPFSTENRNAFG